jgi:PAS domain S-box-containing protein
VSLLLGPSAPPLTLGFVVAVSFIAAESLLMYLLKQVAPDMAFGVVYLLGVLVVSTVWGRLAVGTSVASAIAFSCFRNRPGGNFILARAENWVAIAVFLVVALAANTLAGVARSRAAEADQRRLEADLAAELARLVLPAADLRSALDIAAQRLAQVLGLAFAALELEVVPADERRSAVPLRDGARVLGTLLVPADLPKPTKQRLRERVVPSLEALLAAGRDREANTMALEVSRRQLERFFDLSSDLLGIGAREDVSAELVPRAGPGGRTWGAGYFTRVNQAFERTLGYSSQELLSRPFVDFVHPADRSRMDAVQDELARGHGPTHFEHRCICKDGSERWLEWNVAPDQGLLYAAARDVTERRREQDRLREAQRMVEASRDELGVLAEQQAALRRVATLVAGGASPSEVFSAVAGEVARCLGVYYAALWRYEPDGAAIVLAARNDPGLTKMSVGERFSLEGESVAAMVFRSGRPTRARYENAAAGSAAARIRELGLRSAVGAPIVVDGRVWGAAIVGSARPESLPPDTEARVGDFAELVATAIANAEARAQLTESRARIVAAADEARRRFERDLHDGAQQRLVSLGLALRAAEASVPPELHPLRAQISPIVTGLTDVLEDLQEISRGIHPAILSRGGLAPALNTLARRSAVPVELELDIDRRLPESAEVAAYYVVAEALTNVTKHAHASAVTVRAETEGGDLCLSIRDDGIGGANSGKGSGLIGLIDRVEAVGGHIQITSQPGNGTSLLVKIPIEV